MYKVGFFLPFMSGIVPDTGINMSDKLAEKYARANNFKVTSRYFLNSDFRSL